MSSAGLTTNEKLDTAPVAVNLATAALATEVVVSANAASISSTPSSTAM